MKNNKKICEDCGPLPKNHAANYIESLLTHILPVYPVKLALKIEQILEKFFFTFGLLRRQPYCFSSFISSRSSVFVDEGMKRGWKFFIINGPFGFTGRFQMEKSGKVYSFEGLPRAEFLEDKKTQLVDDKALVKKILLKEGIPAPEGDCFNLFEIKKAERFAEKLGFPLVIKPRSGSISHHVFVNISGEKDFKKAIKSVFSYEPYAIIERFISDVKTYRATVVDFSNIAVVERMPAHIVGDGENSVEKLIEIKNADSRRGNPKQKDTTLYRLVVDEKTEELLRKQGHGFYSVPASGERVFLQEKVILDLGADLFGVTAKAHPDNIELFKKVARIFNTRLVGIDFLSKDISRSWKDGSAAVIELNSLPYIDMHHFPTEGESVNVAGFICDLVEEHYV